MVLTGPMSMIAPIGTYTCTAGGGGGGGQISLWSYWSYSFAISSRGEIIPVLLYIFKLFILFALALVLLVRL